MRPDLKQETMALRNENRILIHDHVARTNSLRTPPPFEELLRRRDQAYDQGHWAEYLVQALTIHLGVRTKDLEMEISDVDRARTRRKTISSAARGDWVDSEPIQDRQDLPPPATLHHGPSHRPRGQSTTLSLIHI